MADQSDRDLAHYEATERRNDLRWRASFDLMVHYSGTAADIGIGVLRTAILINAGALVALLAFVAQIWNKDDGRQIGAAAISTGGPFVVGVIAGAVAFGVAYIYQSALALQAQQSLAEISGALPDQPKIWANRTRIICRAVMVALAVVSLLSFVWGAWRISYVLRMLAH